MNVKKIIAAAAASVVAVSTMAVAASAANYAGLYFQTNTYGFRNNLAQGRAIYWDEFDEAADYATWEYTDVEITGDGQYTVSFNKSIEQDTNAGAENAWNILGLQTNISHNDYPDVQITIDSLKVDGVEVADAKNGVCGYEESKISIDSYSDGCHGITDTIVDVYSIGLFNNWNTDQQIIDPSASFGGKVELTFTITGLGSAGGDEGEASGTGDTNAATNSNKGNADTGIEGVAVVAGIAVLAAGAIIVAKKRK